MSVVPPFLLLASGLLIGGLGVRTWRSVGKTWVLAGALTVSWASYMLLAQIGSDGAVEGLEPELAVQEAR